MLTEKMIKALEEKGFNRWQKGDKDRLYINAEDLGLELSYYKSGNVSAAWMDGELISNAEGRRLSGAKTYIDVATGKLHGTHETLTEKAQAIYDEVSEAVAAEEAEEKKPADAAMSSIKGEMESMIKTFDDLMEEDRAAAARRQERAKLEREANATFKLRTKIRLVEEGKSRIYENWHEFQGITKEDFIKGLEWLCNDPLTEEGRVTRELGCKKGRLHRLERRWGKCGTMSVHDIDTGERFEYCNGSGASITVRDRI